MSNYYYQTRNGKKVRVRKGLKASLKRDISAGTKSAAASAGFVVGTGAGVSVARVISKSPVLKTVSMSLGAIAGATGGNIIANRVLYKKKLDYSQSIGAIANFAKEDPTYR